MKNREIKFRAWIPKHKKMETGLFGLRSDGQTSFNSIAILMQFTGLTDKNGKEIYEGDIVKASWVRASKGGYMQMDDAFVDNEITVTVQYIANGFYYVRQDGKRASIPSDANIEIIGNIHETTELLNG